MASHIDPDQYTFCPLAHSLQKVALEDAMVAGNFSVLAVGEDDIVAVAQFLSSCAALPTRPSWAQVFRSIIGPDAFGETQRRFPRDGACMVVDKTAAIRAFCVIRWLCHPHLHDMMDIPILVVESGPNKDEVARTLFDRLTDMAAKARCSVLRFWSSDASGWERWQRNNEEQRMDIGLIVPVPPEKRPPTWAPPLRIAVSPIPELLEASGHGQVRCSHWLKKMSAERL